MTSPASRSTLIAVAVLAALLWWILSRPDTTPVPPPVEPPPQAKTAAPIESAPALERRAAPAAPEPAPPTAGPGTPGPRTPGPGGREPAEPIRGVAGTVREIVTIGRRQPVAGVRVTLETAGGESIATTVTRADGAFAFDRDDLPEKLRLVTQDVGGEGPRLAHPLPTWARGRPTPLWVLPFGWIRGRVVDGSGQPVSGAAVSTDFTMPMPNQRYEVLEKGRFEATYGARTGSDGSFLLTALTQGEHRLRAEAAGSSGSVDATTGADDVVIRLGGHAIDGVMFAGRITDASTGKGIEDARVHAKRVETVPGGRSSRGVASATTDADGRYRLAGIEPATIELSIRARGYARAAIAAAERGPGEHRADVALWPVRSLVVEVRQDDGKPFAKAAVRVEAPGGSSLTMTQGRGFETAAVATGANGRAQLRGLPARPLTLLVAAGELRPVTRIPIDLTTAIEDPVVVPLPYGPAPRGSRKHWFRLLGPDGKPARVEGTAVVEARLEGRLFSRAEGRWRGDEFVFGFGEENGFSTPHLALLLPPATCQVELRVPGYAVQEFEIAPGATTPTVVRLVD